MVYLSNRLHTLTTTLTPTVVVCVASVYDRLVVSTHNHSKARQLALKFDLRFRWECENSMCVNVERSRIEPVAGNRAYTERLVRPIGSSS